MNRGNLALVMSKGDDVADSETGSSIIPGGRGLGRKVMTQKRETPI
jgi:hypothetical protein